MSAGGRSPPAKPWERPGSATGNNGPSPFAPPSTSKSTDAPVTTATDGQKDDPGKVVSFTSDGNMAGRPMNSRPWEQRRPGYGTGGLTDYGRSGMYGDGVESTGYGGWLSNGNYGSSSYGSPYMRTGMYGSQNRGGLYGSSYGGIGGGMYSNRYGSGYGGTPGMGSYGMGEMGGGYLKGPGDSNFPPGEPRRQGFWQLLLKGLTAVLHFSGRLSMLVDENTQAFHFFITALLQLCDRAGILYGELARFVLGVLGFRSRSRARARSKALEGAQSDQSTNSKFPPEQGWDNVWTDGSGPPA